jgi:hypothetical protein
MPRSSNCENSQHGLSFNKRHERIHIPSRLCSLHNPNRRGGLRELDPEDLHPKGLVAFYKDLFRRTDIVSPWPQVQSKRAARKDCNLLVELREKLTSTQTHQKQLPNNTNSWSFERFLTVTRAFPLAFLWYVFCCSMESVLMMRNVDND